MKILAEQQAKADAETSRLMKGYKGDEAYPDNDQDLGWDDDVDGTGEGLSGPMDTRR